MTNWTELKRLAESIKEGCGLRGADAEEAMFNFECAATPETILALIAENERLSEMANRLADDGISISDERDQLRAEVEALRNSLRQISNEVDCNMRPLIRDLVNRACGLDNGANPNDLYVDCDRIDEIIDSALDSNQ